MPTAVRNSGTYIILKNRDENTYFNLCVHCVKCCFIYYKTYLSHVARNLTL